MNPSRTWSSPVVWIHLLLLRPLLRLFFGVSVEGREHLAGLEQFILAANHNSHLDLPVLFGLLPVARIRTTHPVAARDYFGRRAVLFRLVDYLFKPIWVVRGEPSGKAVDEMLHRLADGHSIIIFPEGTRGTPGEIGRFRTGVGRLVEKHPGVPALPVFLCGPERALPKHSSVPLPLWNRAVIGPQQRFSSDCQEIAASLESMVRELSESETGNRHRRIPRARRCPTVAVLGIDGSGKSTLSRRLARALSIRGRVSRISDRLEFYEDGVCTTVRSLPSEAVRQALGSYAKTAKSLRHYKIPKLAELLLRDHLLSEMRRWHAPEIAVLDGSPLINLTAWARLYKKELTDPAVITAVIRVLTGRDDGSGENDERLRLPELQAMQRLRIARLAMPDVVLMLDVDPAVSMERIRARGERIQAHESEEKLARLREGYLAVCKVVRTEFGVPVSVLDGGHDPDALVSEALDFLRTCREKERDDVDRAG
jgi:1-acyl-sn-glycerol-3-phosphate acyltransferase/thymidylate kinase